MSATSAPQISRRAARSWRLAQGLVLAVGVFIWAALLVRPSLGLNLLWNLLIPVAPLLLLLAPGIWRNVCPLATVALLPRKLRLSRRWRIPKSVQPKMALTGVVLLFAIVPLRHVTLDLNGPATALFLAAAALVAVLAGALFEWKSGWCAGICPVRPVEMLYGHQPLASFDNAHCKSCEVCTAACPDSAVAPHPGMGHASGASRMVSELMFGAFPGFIWGWSHVPHYEHGNGWQHLGLVYGMPAAGAACTWLAYALLRQALGPARRSEQQRAFALVSLGTYYFYRLPALIGFGLHAQDGMLLDLSARVPAWTPRALEAFIVTALVAWFLWRRAPQRSWQRRPPFARAERFPV